MEFWFDRNEGVLIGGKEAYQERMEQAFPSDMVPLADVLLGRAEVDHTEMKPKPKGFPFDKDDTVAYGAWILRVLRTAEPDAHLLREHIERAHEIRIGPSIRQIGSIYRLREQLDAPHFSAKGRYSEWSTQNFVENAADLSVALKGQKPKATDYQEWARQGNGPGLNIIRGRFKYGISALNEPIGFPDIKRYEHDDYVNWGVRVMCANEGRLVGAPEIFALSARRRGPSLVTVVRHFAGITPFTTEVQERYEYEQVLQEEHAKQALKLFAKLREDILPVDAKEWSKSQKVAFVARHKLVTSCMPGAEIGQIKRVASLENPTAMVKAMNRFNPELTAGAIERKAVALGVFDDIWSMYPHDAKNLRISAKELEVARENYRKQH